MKTLLIDCSALCYSSAHTLRGLEHEEIQVGVLFGFLRQLRSLSERFNTSDFVFLWDSKSSDRKKLFPEYKVKRGKSRKEDPELAAIFQATYEQIKKLKLDILPRMGYVNSFEQEGKEADDLLANIVEGYKDCVIVTGDEDLLQMLDLCDMWSTGKKKLLTAEWFEGEYGIHPYEWAEVKAYGGCKTDEVPGIPIPDGKGGWSSKGVGPGTAIKYIKGELPSHWKAFKAIKSEHGQEVYRRNLPLVKLPMDGTKDIELKEQGVLNFLAFWDICQELRFEMFMKGTEKVKWDLFLRGEL